MLFDELYDNTTLVVEERNMYMVYEYNNLQAYVIELLRNHSCTSHLYAYKIEIGNLYIKNYYKHTKIEYNYLGEKFKESFKNKNPPYPTLDELDWMTNKLEQYLTSQNFEVTYTSHCCLRVAWHKII